ncbi:hypothetical protein QRO11_17650 [Paracidovorax citrulli]|uniref:Uncharacterized protein n=3 Tax=Pseudomonadota TaxID=1224 RepID=A1TLI6_PARC0|nr:hypothetical protein [Paracidovorax citrulli]ABM31824.1 conserved hypothetical protein [Paracidovorax citrulli AAC00-1]ATG95113.1 hypothetical protein CQB05_14665 [Paracidovorax citrulli]PVY66013.1 hypothetical protein C8E08_3402 [Paracidovorax citrulli]QCX11744.1 hypothetical protein APS58_2950 [Paracidovorax citrulli]REG69814.1 hypothetical protein C8E07_2983 [Paracidovorax citrulli]
MAISWITALQLVPWDKVIEASPQLIKAAKGLLRSRGAQEAEQAQADEEAARLAASTAPSPQELALQRIGALEDQVQALEQSQRQALEVIEQLAQQNAQLVATVSALRTGAQRLAVACGVLGVVLLGMVAYTVARA